MLTVARHNPNYPHSDADVHAEWDRLASAARGGAGPGLRRPLLVLAGYRAPQKQASMAAEALRSLCGAPAGEVAPLSYTWLHTPLEVCRSVASAARERFGDREVDVAAISMGGLIARLLDTGLLGVRLRIARLFTIATPHRGAMMARVVRPDPCAAMMRPGSELLRELEAARAGSAMEMVCYARLGDRWVGTRACAPPGQEPIWSPGLRVGTHFVNVYDRRSLLDVARRLMGLEPWGRPGGMPLDEP